MAVEIRVGTSGYQYQDWRGSFYPSDIEPQQMLPYYARVFDVVELNFTFYGIPRASTIERMVRLTPPTFRFFVKANERTTHDKDRSVAPAFKDGIEPARAAGKLSGILAQFPWGFKNEAENRRYLMDLREDFADYPLVVEFRHASWIRPEIFDFLRKASLGFCCVDEPRIRGLVPPLGVATTDTAYIRFHSRNAARWFDGDAKERYNYLYTREEMAEWIPRIRTLAEHVSRVYVFFNNCHAGHAAVNATQFKDMLRELGMLAASEGVSTDSAGS